MAESAMTNVRRDPEGIERAILQRLAQPADARALEIGCGDGRLTWQYAGAASAVCAIDPDASRIAQAVRARPDALAGKLTFALAQSEALPFRNNAFDLVIMAWSL